MTPCRESGDRHRFRGRPQETGDRHRFRGRTTSAPLVVSLAAVLATSVATAQPPGDGAVPPPPWLGSRAGVSDEVLPPWTPLVVSGARVRPWGRDYGFGPLPFPASVVATGSDLLAGPVTLSGVVDGRRVAWTGRQARVTGADPQRVRLKASARARGTRLGCEGTASVEFDGMVRTDFTLVPRGNVDVERLELEIPVRREHARYLYCWPGRCGTQLNGGALPAGGYRGPFQPFVWIGDDRAGLAWFAESERGLVPGGDGAVLDVRDDGRAVVLRIVLVGRPRRIDAPVSFTFGFQATPVKPLGRTVWDDRPGGADYDHETRTWLPPAGVTYPLDATFDPARGTLECWVRPRFDPAPSAADPAARAASRNHAIADLELGNGTTLGLHWNREDRGPRLALLRHRQRTALLPTRPGWKAGEWHHVAFAWDDGEVRLYLDGRLAGAAILPPSPASAGRAPEGGGTLVLGRPESGMDFDDVRLSDVARESFDVDRPAPLDAHTRLLDRLDDVPAQGAGFATRTARGPAGTLIGGTGGPGRFGRCLAVPATDPHRTLLDHQADLGARTLRIHEQWADTQAGARARRPDALRRLIDAVHAKGLSLLLYFGYQISDRTPDAARFADACRVTPASPHRMGAQTVSTVCYASPWHDFVADGIARRLADDDIDGVYLDGTSEPWGCTNAAHGCGWTRPDGTPGKTYPIFAVRDLMKRIYTLVKRHDPDGQVNVHQSACMVIPTLAFATSYVDGEHLAGRPGQSFPRDVLPLDAFRAEFMGRNWGVPAELMAGRAMTSREALSLALVHDVPIRDPEAMAPVWRAFDAFGRAAADCAWIPYWDAGARVRTGSPDVLASLHVRPGRGLLAVVANVGRTPLVADIAFDLAALGLPDAASARDALDDTPLPLDAGHLALQLAPSDFRLVRIPGDGPRQ